MLANCVFRRFSGSTYDVIPPTWPKGGLFLRYKKINVFFMQMREIVGFVNCKPFWYVCVICDVTFANCNEFVTCTIEFGEKNQFDLDI